MRKLRFTFIVTCFCLPLLAIACGDSDEGEEPFDTFQDCFDDHHLVEAFDVIDSIKICCIDHPIGDDDPDVVCGESAAACEVYVDLELEAASASVDEIEDACAEYIIDRDL